MSDLTQILLLGILEEKEIEAIESALQKVIGVLDKEKYTLKKISYNIYFFQWNEYFKVPEFLRHIIRINKKFDIQNVLLFIKREDDMVFRDIRIFNLSEDSLRFNNLSFGGWIDGISTKDPAEDMQELDKPVEVVEMPLERVWVSHHKDNDSGKLS